MSHNIMIKFADRNVVDVKEKVDIIKEVFGRDVMSVITEYLFHKCHLCKRNYEYFYLNKTPSDNEYLCDNCIFEKCVSKCNKCDLFYLHVYRGLQCKICKSNCHFYCHRCLKRKYYLGNG